MFGQQLLILLPSGILPLILPVTYLVWKVLQSTGQRTFTDDRRFGTTEFPTEVSSLLCGTNRNELAFSEDGKSVILTIANAHHELPNSSSAQQCIRDDRQIFCGEIVFPAAVINKAECREAMDSYDVIADVHDRPLVAGTVNSRPDPAAGFCPDRRACQWLFI